MFSKQLIIALQRAEEVMRDPNSDFVTQGEHLAAVKDLSEKDYSAVVARSGISGRKAYYWVAIHRSFRGLGIPKDRLRKIGWTKLKDLTAHVTKDNVKDLLKLAETHTGKDLERLLQGEEVLGRARAVNLRLTAEQYDVLEKAMLRFGALRAGRGLEAKEEAIVAMAAKLLEE